MSGPEPDAKPSARGSPGTFRFDGTPSWKGIPEVNGHKIMTCSSFDVHMAFGELPQVTMTLLPAGGLSLVLGDADWRAKVCDETREALISLGWTPPSGPPAPLQILTCDDPQPAPEAVVRDRSGTEWTLTGTTGAWHRSSSPDGDGETESWAGLTGTRGPVTLIVQGASSLETCSVTYPVERDQALGWAAQARWYLKSYYKYEFTFSAYCTVAYPDDPEFREVEALAVVSGSDGDIYRFQADTEKPQTWENLTYLRTPDLIIRDENGTELIRVSGDE